MAVRLYHDTYYSGGVSMMQAESNGGEAVPRHVLLWAC